MRAKIKADYFDWMVEIICEGRHRNPYSYGKLLTFLHKTKFRYFVKRDENRAGDGVNLRRRFALLHDDDCYDEIMDALSGPCTVLEMMIALALRCEETIMDDPKVGNRTQQWFWYMLKSLGISTMTDKRFDEREAVDIIDRFLERDYEPDGRGGLFIVRNCDRDLRTIEIWHQLLCYLNTIT